MGIELKSYESAKEYFSRAIKTSEIGEIILFHNQRDTVRTLIKEASEAGKRTFLEKDLTTLADNELSGIKTDNKIPGWLKPAMNATEKDAYVIFLREFHAASPKVKDDVLNILVKKEVQSFKLPCHTLLVIGVLEDDAAAAAVGHTHTVRFYK